ncbi:uncharacterized protein BX663DRAFT_489367 [Cokeromyces recurvatus]|uniref:uncharacterized protein n=1 Tax=Cokeromyces recurvatus TaxID=90255 RepID=UPI00221E49B6|nr:uncharacterized protein BX663DRAFT_489367 [Cokeromyces recurvatus]KAI7899253.1 hypothetical protein BX663DRAFT_489367 [Cokeromyces recurvatus]
MQSMPYYQQQQGYQQPYQPQASVLNNGAPMMNQPPHGLPPMQHPGIPDQVPPPPQQQPPQQQAPKRKQVKNACTNCQKACKKCDDARPCPRCIKYGIADTCVNSVRKERKKGIKRGPYKRRQKTGEEKPRKTTTTNTANSINDHHHHQQQQQQQQQHHHQHHQQPQPTNTAPTTQYAPSMRGPALPFGYPQNLNQYGQHYDPYGQYTYHKDQMMPQPYVVNPVYPPMGYPILVPGATAPQQNDHGQHQPSQQPQQQQPQQQPQHAAYHQHYNTMIQQQSSPQLARPPMMQQHTDHVIHQPSPAGSPQIYYQPQTTSNQSHSQPPSQRNSPHLPDIKTEPNAATTNTTNTATNTPTNTNPQNDHFAKPQSMTPIPSTSTSTATTSSPDSGSWVPPRA